MLKIELRKAVKAGEVDLTAFSKQYHTGVMLISPETVKSRNIWMGVGVLAPEEAVPSGAHPSEEALFLLRGSGVLFAEGQDILMKAGSAVYIPENIEHSMRNTGKENLLFVFSMSTPHAGDLKATIAGEICFNCS